VSKPTEGVPSRQIKEAAEKINRLAKAQGLTIEELSRKAGRPFQSFINWKKGHTTAKLESLEAFATVVGATVTLNVNGPGESDGLRLQHQESIVIAQMIDSWPEETRKMWRERVDQFANAIASRNWPLPPEPPADEAPRARRKTGSRR
jgi:transcriptional regulator with XRE-family HTH domain